MIAGIKRVDLRKLSRRWHVVYNEQGKPVEQYSVADKSTYYRLQRELAAVGRDALEDFTLWQVLELGRSEGSAARASAVVWVALYSTGANPIERVADPTMNWYYRVQLRSYINRLAAWILGDADADPEDRTWARDMITKLASVPLKQSKKPKKAKKKTPNTPPITPHDLSVLHEVVERRHKRHGFLRPWAKPVMSIMLKTAPGIASELCYIERDTLLDALTEHDDQGKTGALPLWSRRKKARLIPVALIEDELRTLAAWPADWGTISDIIAPRANHRTTYAAAQIRKELKETFAEAGIEWIPSRSIKALKWGAMLEVFKRTKDLVTIQQVFGVSVEHLKRFSCFDVEVDKSTS